MIKLFKNTIPVDIDLPFFAKKEFLESKSNNFGWFVSKDFILPFTIFDKFIFKRLVFTTEVININNSSINEEKKFLNEIIIYIKKNKICDFIHKPQPSAVFRTYPDNCDAFRWASYKIDIEANFDNMLKKLYKSQRNHVRNAIKENVEIIKIEDFDEIYTSCNETLARQNIPLLICQDEFKKQYDTLHPKNMLMFKAVYKNETQGTLVIFFDKESAYAEYSGSILKPRRGSLKLLHLKAMEYLAINYHIKDYDFIGAISDIKEDCKEAGIQRFKKEFGASLKEGYQFKYIINPFKYFIFDFSLKLSFKLRGIDYIDPIDRYKRLSKSNLEI